MGGVLVLLLVVGGLLMWRVGPEPEPVVLAVGTGPTGGVYHAYGTGLEQVTADAMVRVEARPTAASVANIRMVQTGQIGAGFTLADVAALAVAGDPPFSESQQIRAIARLYDNHTHLVVRADSPYQEVAELAGQPVSVGAADSGTEMIAERILGVAGLGTVADGGDIDRRQLDLGASAQALQGGEIEAFFWSGGLPTEAITTLAQRVPIRLIDLSHQVPDLSGQYGDYFTELPVPAGTYPGVPAVRTIGVPSLLVVHQDMADDVAEELTRTLFEARTDLAEIHPVALQLSARSAIATLPVPLHAGSMEYFRSVKSGYDEGADPGS